MSSLKREMLVAVTYILFLVGSPRFKGETSHTRSSFCRISARIFVRASRLKNIPKMRDLSSSRRGGKSPRGGTPDCQDGIARPGRRRGPDASCPEPAPRLPAIRRDSACVKGQVQLGSKLNQQRVTTLSPLALTRIPGKARPSAVNSTLKPGAHRDAR